MLHADGVDGGTTFTDSSSSAQTVTANGNAQLDTAQKQFGTASALFDGTGDFLSIGDSEDWNFGTGDFTIDFWIRFNATEAGATDTLLDIGDGNVDGIQINQTEIAGPTEVLSVVINGNTFTFDWNPSTATWYHVAVTRSGTNLRSFIDGTQIGVTETNNSDITSGAGGVKIGSNSGGGSAINGWIDELRIVKGTAVWTSNFTPPTAAYTQFVASASRTVNNSILTLGVG